MRVLLAGVFVFTVTLGLVGVIGWQYPDNNWPWWAIPSIVAAMLGSMIASLILFNMPGYHPSMPGKTIEEYVAELQEKDMLISEPFTAKRAFQVEEFEDEGSHYYIELADGAVLYLNGQYLYDYEEITDDPEYNQPRRFPCTQFTIRRHKTEGYVVDIICGGDVLHPEIVALSFEESDMKRGLIPEDGQIFRDRSYEQLKHERVKGEGD